jgi:glycosyltransferase involved in cell wall biosynthesis
MMAKTTPSVSLFIPTFNQAAFLPTALESGLNQTGGLIKEIIVCDDASTDETPGILEDYRQNRGVIVIRNESNQGISANASRGLRACTGELVIRLDSDDILDPNYTERLSTVFLEHPKVAVAHCAVQEIEQQGAPLKIRRLARKRGFQNSNEALREAHRGYKVTANICMFRKQALEESGYYREGMNFAEDWDLWVRMADAGWGNYYNPSVLASYRVWTDEKGFRASRKLSELSGIRTVFASALEPAYAKRGWSTTGLRNARVGFACNHARSLKGLAPTCPERIALEQSLEKLGGGWRFTLWKHWLNSPFHRISSPINHLVTKAKHFLKSALYSTRSSG